ncbi:MAG: cadmium-translocating P-type ATPase [Gemmatimonadetes bacterium SCN 70-22]|nr:MAG: cadmium-translocating P-type ATPase [Gemmatimonadetes bacterium SCN 70-22]
MTRARWLAVARIALVGAIVAVYGAGLLPLPALLATVAVGLWPLVRVAALQLLRERKVGTELFVTVATVVAMLGHEYVAGAVMMTIILIAELIAELNTERARASIRSLLGSVPQTALVRRPQGDARVPLAEVRPGDVVIVRAGEKVPVDGAVRVGDASVNEAPITGESMPKEKRAGATVFAGTVVELGAIDVVTERAGSDTMFARILALVESAEESRAPVQRLADRVAAWLIPVVLVFLLGVWIVTRDVRLIITLLIFTSPAELGLATPLVVIAGIARAARAGILLKGGIYLEELAKARVLAFDKTGTLTVGRPQVMAVERFGDAADEETLIRLAAAAERRSSHPLAAAVVARASGLDVPEPSSFEVVAGRGVRATVEGRSVLAGNAALLTESGIVLPVGGEDTETSVYVAADGVALGVLRLADPLRPGARSAIQRIRATGIRRVVMLTGDNATVAWRVARELGVDEVLADLLPDAKVDAIRRLQAGGVRVAMVGDGINDAPALAVADVGIAMGVAGTQAAIEAADVALMTDDLGKIAEARLIARKAYRTIQENLFVGVGVVHVLGIVAALLHWIGPVQAAVIHLGPDVLVFFNSVKLLRFRLA